MVVHRTQSRQEAPLRALLRTRNISPLTSQQYSTADLYCFPVRGWDICRSPPEFPTPRTEQHHQLVKPEEEGLSHDLQNNAEKRRAIGETGRRVLVSCRKQSTRLPLGSHGGKVLGIATTHPSSDRETSWSPFLKLNIIKPKI